MALIYCSFPGNANFFFVPCGFSFDFFYFRCNFPLKNSRGFSEMDVLNKIYKLTGAAIGDYSMIRNGDSILAGVSGGKDSMLLLHVLARLRRRAPVRFSLTAVTFDPGFPGFDADGTKRFCEELEVPHHVIRLNVQNVIERTGTAARPCILCSRLRRGHLYALAKRLGCNKLALGQHLDDIAVSFLISCCRGGGLTTMGPNGPSDDAAIRVIRPFAYVEEKMTVRAAAMLQIPPRGECIYKRQLEESGDRAYFKRQLREMERHIPNLLPNILHSLSDVRPSYLLDRRFLELE